MKRLACGTMPSYGLTLIETVELYSPQAIRRRWLTKLNPQNVREPTGYVEVILSAETSGVKIIVSDWSSSEDRGGMLTGVMFMYSMTDG